MDACLTTTTHIFRPHYNYAIYLHSVASVPDSMLGRCLDSLAVVSQLTKRTNDFSPAIVEAADDVHIHQIAPNNLSVCDRPHGTTTQID